MSGIEVHVRLRPVGRSAWSASDTVLFAADRADARFVFNHVHSQATSNSSLFHHIEPLVTAAFSGQNVTVMAYGQTGSGKTHSMLGSESDRGFIPRTADLLIKLAHAHGASLRGCCIEVYNEAVRDLLAIDREVVLRDYGDSSIAVERTSHPIASMSDFVIMSTRAENSRKYGVTDMNEHSSRSHTILTFEISRGASKSTLNFVDLAGSESAAKSNTAGAQLREGGFINRSLLALGNVVDAIVEGRSHIPYRESKLTRVLRPCLGGRSLTFVLACVNPAASNTTETLAALRFAQRAMKIKNDPTAEIVMAPLLTHKLGSDLQQWSAELENSKRNSFARGLHDAYTYCIQEISGMVRSTTDEVKAVEEHLEALNVALLAHDKKMALDRLMDAENNADHGSSHVEHLARENAAQHAQAKRHEEELHDARARLAHIESTIEETKESTTAERHRLRLALNEAARNQFTPFVQVEMMEAHQRLALTLQYFDELGPITEAFAEPFPRVTGQLKFATSEELLATFKTELQRKRAEVGDLEAAAAMAQGELERLPSAPRHEDLSVEAKVFNLQQRERDVEETLRSLRTQRTVSKRPPSVRPAEREPSARRSRSECQQNAEPGAPQAAPQRTPDRSQAPKSALEALRAVQHKLLTEAQRVELKQVKTPPKRAGKKSTAPPSGRKPTPTHLAHVKSRYMEPSPRHGVDAGRNTPARSTSQADDIVGIAARRRAARERDVDPVRSLFDGTPPKPKAKRTTRRKAH